MRGSGFGVYAVAPSAQDLAHAERVAHELRTALPHEQVRTIALGVTDESLTDGDIAVTDDGGTAQEWSTTAGEIVVVRPDGLVMARGRAGEMTGLAERLQGPGTAATPSTETASYDASEQVWLALSDALDGTDDREGLLAQLAFVLGAEVGPERLRATLAEITPGPHDALTDAITTH